MVQPPVGKLLIAVGEWLYGLTSLGWRLRARGLRDAGDPRSCAGSPGGSPGPRCSAALAGLLLSLDGLEFVLSRTGILDIFLMFFVLAAFGALVVDRDVSRARLAEAMVLQPERRGGARARDQEVARRWRACSSASPARPSSTRVWYIFAFAGLCIAWDIGARRTVGLRGYVRGALVRDGKWLPLTLGVIPLVTYVLTWTGWLVTNTGYDRDYAQLNGVNIPVLGPLYSLFEYHKEMFQFGVGLSARHPYESQPWDWFLITRPVAFYWKSYTDAAGTARGQGGHDRPVGAGSARDRQPGHLVAVDPRDGLLPRLVADPPGLAGGRRPARRRRRVGELAAVRLADQVLLLRA